MIVLFTDFGADDIYVGQMKAALVRYGAGAMPIIDLTHCAPNFDARGAAHLLAALQGGFDPGAVFLAVVDPGVGSAREAVLVQADGKSYVGPDNGLLSVVAARAADTRIGRIAWRPPSLSASFHGRDLFAPVGAMLATGSLPVDAIEPIDALAMRLGADDLAQVIYVDHYGNVLTGLRAARIPPGAAIEAGGLRLRRRRTFAEAAVGEMFWHENSIGLVEIAVNQGSAGRMLNLAVGAVVAVV